MMQRVPEQPAYRVLHNNVGGLFAQGDLIPPGTYDDEQLARLLGLGAIEAVAPGEEPRPAPTATAAPVAELPPSAEAFKAAQTAAALATARGETPPALTETPRAEGQGDGATAGLDAAELTDPQRQALAEAGYTTDAQVRAAADEELLAVPGIGPATLRQLRELTAE
jgi:hypothetical protein